jgi:hypothetical protein
MSDKDLEFMELQEAWDNLLWEGDRLTADAYMEQLTCLALDAEELIEYSERAGVRWSMETILGSAIKARLAEAKAAMRRGIDPRRCYMCGGDHLDVDPRDDFGSSAQCE